MPKILWKSLYLCFPSNLTKCYSSPCLPPSSTPAADDTSRPSIVLINNSNVIYHDDDHLHLHSVIDLPSSSTATTSSSVTSSFDSDNHDISPDLSAAFASRRFFFSSPGRSNAITDSPETRSKELSDSYVNPTIMTKKKKNNYDTSVTTTRLLRGGTAVKQHVYSPDPLTTFRLSMQEMIDAAIVAGDLTHHEDEYNFLNELLLSYLALNPTDTHKFVIRAFSQILVSLLSEESRIC